MSLALRFVLLLVGTGLIAWPNLRGQTSIAYATIVVARNGLEAGSLLTRNSMRLHRIPSEFVHPFQVPAEDLDLLDGRSVRYGLQASQPLLWSDLSERQESASRLSVHIPEGYRAITLPLRTLDTFGGLVEAGDAVDVWWIQNSVPQLLLASVPIAALGGSMPGESRPVHPQTVTFAMPAAEAEKLLSIRNRSDISFLLRNPADVTDISTGRALRELGLQPRKAPVSKPKSPAPEPGVQILLGK